ncbi:MAG: Phosphoadenosine phosphosulfate reductase [Acidimicrobiaceae bacterium]|nr:Phosphoadenosine phosphosulfate reductase [Acidimicrobiaceae bacterium]
MTTPDTTVQIHGTPSLSRSQVRSLNLRFEDSHPTQIIRWAVGRFGNHLALTTSFSDTLLVDLALSIDPDIEVVFLDTGFHFAETLDVLRRSQVRYEMNLRVERPDPATVDLWAKGSDACCAARKVAPLERALNGKKAWLSGLRRDDSTARADTPIVSIDRRGLVKVNPIAAWPTHEVEAYSEARGIISNPLGDDGYESIGCWPCTERTQPDSDTRSGRWAGTPRTECGIHL